MPVQHSLPHRWALLFLLPLFWLSGRAVMATPTSLDKLVGMSGGDIAIWLAQLFVPPIIVGIVLSLIANALGPATLRTLLSTRQALLFGTLVSILLWLSVTGIIWASIREDRTAVVIWQLIVGAVFDLFTLIWLVLGVRAAAARQPLRTGTVLISAALGLHTVAFWGLVIMGQLQPELRLVTVGIYVLLLAAYIFVPPALTACGVAALCSGLRRPSAGEPDGSDPLPPAPEG